MCNQNNNIRFLKYQIKYLENRIGMLDNKCGILIAIQAGFFGLATLLLKPILEDDFVKCRIIGYLILGFLLVFSAGTIYYLIRTIRPTRRLWDRAMGLQKYLDNGTILIWPTDNFPIEDNVEAARGDYNTRIESADIEGNYRHAHFAALQLVKRKYRYYAAAILWVKAVFVWGVTSCMAIMILKFPISYAGHYSLSLGKFYVSLAILLGTALQTARCLGASFSSHSAEENNSP
ncbi:MAG: hypothetical protein ACYST6_16790 [Planctomycetota bacterium]|jgi:hypothetical protein